MTTEEKKQLVKTFVELMTTNQSESFGHCSSHLQILKKLSLDTF